MTDSPTDDVIDEEVPESLPGDEGQEPQTQEAGQPEGEAATTPADDDAGATRSKGAERRIRQLTAKWRSEQKAKEDLARRLDAIEKRIGPEQPPPRPQRHDYESDEEYEDSLLDWNDQRRATRQPQPQQVETPSTGQDVDPQTAASFKAEVEKLGEETYDAVFTEDWPCSQEMGEFILSSERGVDLAVKLANDWELADRIQSLPPVAQARELVRLEAKLPAKKQPGAVRTPPPPPGTPVKPSGSPVVDQDKLSDDEWARRRRAGEL